MAAGLYAFCATHKSECVLKFIVQIQPKISILLSFTHRLIHLCDFPCILLKNKFDLGVVHMERVYGQGKSHRDVIK